MRSWFDRRDRAPLIGAVSARRIFDRGLALFAAEVPARMARWFPGRRLQVQLLLIVLSALLAGGLAASTAPLAHQKPRLDAVDPGLPWLWLPGPAGATGA